MTDGEGKVKRRERGSISWDMSYSQCGGADRKSLKGQRDIYLFFFFFGFLLNTTTKHFYYPEEKVQSKKEVKVASENRMGP